MDVAPWYDYWRKSKPATLPHTHQTRILLALFSANVQTLLSLSLRENICCCFISCLLLKALLSSWICYHIDALFSCVLCDRALGFWKTMNSPTWVLLLCSCIHLPSLLVFSFLLNDLAFFLSAVWRSHSLDVISDEPFPIFLSLCPFLFSLQTFVASLWLIVLVSGKYWHELQQNFLKILTSLGLL